MFRFADPPMLLLLFLLPAWAKLESGRSRPPALRVPSIQCWVECRSMGRGGFARLLPALRWLALALMVLALARPQWSGQRISTSTEGIAVVLALDTSESMAALDFQRKGRAVSRLEAVKTMALDFLDKRDGDRIALVVFGAEATTQVPLTSDHQAVAAAIERLDIGAAGRSTALGDAVGVGLKRLRDDPGRSKVMIVLTDGRSNSGQLTPEVSTEIAVEQGVKIYPIGVGGRAPAPFTIQDPVLGQRTVMQPVDIDEPALQTMAARTGGLYFRAENEAGLAWIGEAIDRLEKSVVNRPRHGAYRDLYGAFLGTALALLCCAIVLGNTRFLELP